MSDECYTSYTCATKLHREKYTKPNLELIYHFLNFICINVVYYTQTLKGLYLKGVYICVSTVGIAMTKCYYIIN